MRIGILASVGHHLDSFHVDITRRLRENGHSVSLAAGTLTKKIDSELITTLTRRPGVSNLAAVGDLESWAVRRQLDIVVTNTATASFLARMSIRACPVVYFAHGLHWRPEEGITALPWKALETLALRRTAGAIVINSDDERWFQEKAPMLPIRRMKYGVGLDPTTFPRSQNVIDGDLRIAWIGEFSNRKNPFDAISVAQALQSKGVRFRLEMLGEGKLFARAATMIKKLGLDDQVALRGHIDVTSTLTRSNALIHTASWEGLPRVFLEAMSVGRPIFSYDVKGARDLPFVKRTPFRDPSSMADALIAEYRSGFDVPPISPADLSYTNAADTLEQFLLELTSASAD